MDQHADLRSLPLVLVIPWLGINTPWKERKGGSEWAGACPFHQPKRNTTSFSFDSAGRFHCFSCEAKGKGSIDFVMQFRKVGFQDAVEELKRFNGSAIPVPVAVIKQVQEVPTQNEPFKGTYEKFYRPHAWLTERGLEPDTLARYGVGFYQNDKRRSQYNGSVLLRISRYSDGECVGYLSRNIGEITPEKPKYRFPAGLHKGLELWGAWQLKEQAPIRMVYIVESAFSVMHFHQVGFPAVSLLGWSVSPQQLDILAHLAKGVIYLPDQDKRKEAAQYCGLLASKLWVKFPDMPVPDPEKLSAEQIRALS